jgi:predicted dehydrogenase
MRFGLVGTGHWARVTHAPGVAAAEGAQLVGVWGRRPDATAALAEAAGITAYDDYAAMLDDVDAVAFAVPPDVQTQTALAAARAGKHLLLDKPVALDSARAAELAGVVAQAGVAALVFFTSRFQTAVRDWVDEVGARSWEGGTATWLGSAFAPGSPYAGSSWRRERGGLWDVTPHALSVLVPALGPVTHVSAAERGVRDTRHLVLHHESGATSTVTVGIDAAEAAAFNEAVVWGQPGRRPMPWGDDEPDVCLRRATEELLAAATGPTREHPCDLRLGTHVVEVIEAAERVLAGGPAPEGEVRRVHRE